MRRGFQLRFRPVCADDMLSLSRCQAIRRCRVPQPRFKGCGFFTSFSTDASPKNPSATKSANNSKSRVYSTLSVARPFTLSKCGLLEVLSPEGALPGPPRNRDKQGKQRRRGRGVGAERRLRKHSRVKAIWIGRGGRVPALDLRGRQAPGVVSEGCVCLASAC